MPNLDVTDLTFDPDFADSFTVTRRQETVDALGRTVVMETLLTGFVGVVTSDEPNDLERTPDYEAMTRSLSVICKEQLIGALKGFQPDIINWRGGNYIVKHVNPYPQFGRGFYEITCTSINFMDLPFANSVPLPGRMAFNFAEQSYMVPLCF